MLATPRRRAEEFTRRERSWIYTSTFELFRDAVEHSPDGSAAATDFLTPALQALESCADASLPINILQRFPLMDSHQDRYLASLERLRSQRTMEVLECSETTCRCCGQALKVAHSSEVAAISSCGTPIKYVAEPLRVRGHVTESVRVASQYCSPFLL